MPARLTGVRSRTSLLTAASASALALLLAACGGSSAGSKAADPGSQLETSTTSSNAPGQSPAPGGAKATPGSGSKTGAKGSAAPVYGASPAAASTTGGTTGSKAGASPTAAAASGEQPKALKVDVKCRKPASSVGNGVALKGQKPPPFTGTTLDCGSLDFAPYTEGKPTLVNFFASWCEPCHKEAKDLEEIYEKYHSSKGFQVVGVETQDENGSPAWFYDNAHWTFPSVWDDKEKIEKAWNPSGAISTLPASFWIHPDGTVSSIIIGEMSRSQMEDEFNKL